MPMSGGRQGKHTSSVLQPPLPGREGEALPTALGLQRSQVWVQEALKPVLDQSFLFPFLNIFN